MPSTTLIAYATKHDSTHQVAELVADVLRDDGLEVEVRPAGEVSTVEPYAAVVIGGALYAGRWHKDARHLMHQERTALSERPVFVFAMGPLDLEERSVAGARKQLDHALARTPEVEPVAVAIFGGVVHADDLHFPFNHMPEGDARDPDAIRAWAHDIAAVLKASFATATP
jgi:menaquinone-dependent protoporphyrinogen oxidase